MLKKIKFMADPNFYYLEVCIDQNGVLSLFNVPGSPTAMYIADDYKQQYIRNNQTDIGWSTLMWNCGASKKGMDLTTPPNKNLECTRFMQFDDIDSLNKYAGTNYPPCPLE
jgi:hypothetical protein